MAKHTLLLTLLLSILGVSPSLMLGIPASQVKEEDTLSHGFSSLSPIEPLQATLAKAKYIRAFHGRVCEKKARFREIRRIREFFLGALFAGIGAGTCSYLEQQPTYRNYKELWGPLGGLSTGVALGLALFGLNSFFCKFNVRHGQVRSLFNTVRGKGRHYV